MIRTHYTTAAGKDKGKIRKFTLAALSLSLLFITLLRGRILTAESGFFADHLTVRWSPPKPPSGGGGRCPGARRIETNRQWAVDDTTLLLKEAGGRRRSGIAVRPPALLMPPPMPRHRVFRILTEYWLQEVPYCDFDGNNRINLRDYRIACRILRGDYWLTSHNWFCENIYEDGQTESAEGWTYEGWQNEPIRLDLHPEEPGFAWCDPDGRRFFSMNYVWFEWLFPRLTILDANYPVYVTMRGAT